MRRCADMMPPALDAAVVDDKVNDLAGHSQSHADSEPPHATRTASESQHGDGNATMCQTGKGEATEHV